MPTVREATFELFRAHGMTTIFGNPGSTELPMLADFPEDFNYVLGLQELVVVGMADGFAQASGRPTHVNLHTAPGVGNAVGGIFNAQANKSPLVITAGQQVRAHVTIEANLTNRDATIGPQPYVKWSHEPPRPQDVPGAIARAIHHATLPPRGPAFVSVPMDDWDAAADEDRAVHARRRVVGGRAVPDPAQLAELVGESDRQASDPRPAPPAPAEQDPMSGSAAMATLADAWPDGGIAVAEAPSSSSALRNRLRLSEPGSYYQSGSGGLGFAISAAVGVQLAEPDRPVVCVVGEGSAQYGITALWTAAAYKVPVTFLVLRNQEYMILKWFAALEQVDGAPGLQLPGLDVAAVASGYGVPSRSVSGVDELTEAQREDIAADEG